VSQNALRGTVPECIAELPLEWLWLEDNRVHGPISEYSSLGQYLKNVDSLNLAQNRWAPLLRTEKAALEAAAEPLGVTAAESGWAGHSWTFGWDYKWAWLIEAASGGQTAEREVSIRYWAAGVEVVGFVVANSLEFPHQGNVFMTAGIGRDGDLVVAGDYNIVRGVEDSMESGFTSPSCNVIHQAYCSNYQLSFTIPDEEAPKTPEECVALCGHSNGCTNGMYNAGAYHCDLFGVPGAAADTECEVFSYPGGTQFTVFTDCKSAVWSLDRVKHSVYTHGSMECWTTISVLVPGKHTISETPKAATSSQGADYLSGRFCPGWAKFIAPTACDPAKPECFGDDASGNVIFDGGGDMYDLGNVLTTSLMGDCTSDPHGCPLGSLHYQSEFVVVETGCFGPGGHYQMGKFDGVWVFFTHNVGDAPLDFAVAGNLGSDGSGTVTEYIFEAAPYIGFVKRECGSDDPSVNHLVVVDATAGYPAHSCDHTNIGACFGASSNIDDDVVSGITPGSPILYLLYSSEGGRCIKEDEHRAIFDVAVRCLWAEDPYEQMHQSWQAANQPLVEVIVDDRDHIVFGGTAPYTGWEHRPALHRVLGPGGFPTALHFDGMQWLQLGQSGVEIQGNWTLDCYVQVDTQVLHSLDRDGALLVSAEGAVYISVATVADLLPSMSDGWHRLTLQVEQLSMLHRERRTLLIDGMVAAPVSEGVSICGVGSASHCYTTFFAVGGLPDGSDPFPLPVHHLRLYIGIMDPTGTSMPGSVHTDDFSPLRYHMENSRWVEISRGPDAMDITWNTIGWDAANHEQVQVTLEPTGNLLVKGTNASQLWNRAVASVAAITDGRDISNWTTTTSYGAVALSINYLESDPCYDLWDGIECSQSDWPVGRNDCAERLDCAQLGWDPEIAGSATVCGTSTLLGLLDSSDMCMREASFVDATELCQEMGARLCTADELLQDEGDPSACGYDSILAWTWASGGQADVCLSGNQSLGAAGAPGAWYSFSTVTRGVYHEIQLRTEGMSAHSISTDILDKNAELVQAAEHPTLHRRPDGVMLRWNITKGGGPYFVRVTSPDSDSLFSMVLVAPPIYRQAPVDFKSWTADVTEQTELVVSMGSAVPVDLGFSFPFFGLAYEHIWVSSAGYLVFEQPSETEGFVGLDAVHSAVVAAAGEYDLARSGATLTASRLGAMEMEITWHAPIYGSSKFTDVALRLGVDGSIGFWWERIVLDDGGSLQHKLLHALNFDTLPSEKNGESEEDLGVSDDAVMLARGAGGHASIIDAANMVFNVTIGAFYGGILAKVWILRVTSFTPSISTVMQVMQPAP
jgi:hypothetical protein